MATQVADGYTYDNQAVSKLRINKQNRDFSEFNLILNSSVSYTRTVDDNIQ